MNKFIPQKTEKEVISIRIDTNVLKRLDQIASKKSISRNQLINQSIQFALDHIEDTE